MFPAVIRRRGVAAAVVALLVAGAARSASPADAAPPTLTASGFVVHPQGYVVTLGSVVRAAGETFRIDDSYTEVVLGEKSYQAKVVAVDDVQGPALLKIDAADLPWLPIGDATKLELGADVRAFGRGPVWTPEQSADLTLATVTGVAATDEGPRVAIDAAVKPGNAGGPVVNLRGEVVGVIGEGEKLTIIAAQAVRGLSAKAKAAPPVPAPSSKPRDADLANVELARQTTPAVAYVRTFIRRATLRASDARAKVVGLWGADVLVTQGDVRKDPTVKLWDVRTGRLLATYGNKEDGIYGAAFSSGKGILAVTRQSGRVIVISVADRKVLGGWPAFVQGEIDDPNTPYDPRPVDVGVAISADGKTIATAWLNRMKIWDAGGKLIEEFPISKFYGSAAPTPRWALSPDGREVAYLQVGEKGEGARLQFYDRQKKQTRSFPIDHAFSQLAFSPDGRRLSINGLQRLLDAQSGADLGIREESLFDHNAVMASDADRIVSASNSAQTAFVDVWERTHRMRLLRLWGDPFGKDEEDFMKYAPTSICVSADGLSVATGDQTEFVRLWFLHADVDRLPATVVLTGHEALTNYTHKIAAQTALTFSPGGGLVASWAREPVGETIEDRQLISDARTGLVRQKLDLKLAEKERPRWAFSFDDRRFASAARSRGEEGYEITVWNVVDGGVVRTFRVPEDVFGLSLSADGKQLAAFGAGHDACRIWNVENGELQAPLKHGDTAAGRPWFSPDGKTFATIDGAVVRVWDADARRPLRTLETPRRGGVLRHFTYSPDGRRAAAAIDGSVVLWSVADGKLLRELSLPEPVDKNGGAGLLGLKFSPRGDYLVAQNQVARMPPEFLVWIVADGTLRERFTMPDPWQWGVRDFRLSADGGRLIAACADCVLRSFSIGPVPRPSAVVEGFLARGRRRLADKQFEGADADLGRVKQLAPWHVEAYVLLADSRLRQAALSTADDQALWRALLQQSAEADLTTAVELDPQNVGLYQRRGALRFDGGRPRDALADYDVASAFRPRDPFVLIARGKCRDALDDSRGAIADYTSAIQGWPFGMLVDAVHHRGLCYVKTGQWREAVADLQKIKTIVPVDQQAEVAAALQKATEEAAKLPPVASQPEQPTTTAPTTTAPTTPVATEPLAVGPRQFILKLTVPEGAAVSLDGRVLGAQRELRWDDLEPGQEYVSQLVVRFADGGEARRTVLVVPGQRREMPVLAPSRIVLRHRSGPDDEGLFSIRPDGADATRLATYDDDWGAPELSPDGSRIALFREPEKGPSWTVDLWVLDVEGRRSEQVLANEFGLYAWMPDGRRLLAPVVRDETEETGTIVLVDVETKQRRELLRGWSPQPSPDGRVIASYRPGAGGEDDLIELYDLATKQVRRLTTGSQPQWSPGGTQLAFLRRRISGVTAIGQPREVHDLYVAAAAGGGERKLAEDVSLVDEPQWSPDGRWIAYKSDGDIWRIRPTGADRRRLTVYRQPAAPSGTTYSPEDFRWSPDGAQLVFRRSILPLFTEGEIWIVNADGTGLRALVAWQGSSDDPSWR